MTTTRTLAADEFKNQPFTYDNGPLGQRNWCGQCNLETSKLQAPINIETGAALPDGSLPGLDFLDRASKSATERDLLTGRKLFLSASW